MADAGMDRGRYGRVMTRPLKVAILGAVFLALTACGTSQAPPSSSTDFSVPTPSTIPGVVPSFDFASPNVPADDPATHSPGATAPAAWTAPPCSLDDVQIDESSCPDFDETDACDFMWEEHADVDALIENYIGQDLAHIKADCPQYLKAAQKAATGFTEGVEIVGKDIKPGTYKTTGSVSDCYWERERGGHIVANNFVSGASKVQVTVRKTDDAFTTRGCGDWIQVS